MAKKKIAAKARPTGRNKPAAKPGKKAVKTAGGAKSSKAGKKKAVKTSATSSVSKTKKVVAKKSAPTRLKKSAKKPVVKAGKSKPVKAIKKLAPKKVVQVAKPAPKPAKAPKVVAKPKAPVKSAAIKVVAGKKPLIAPKAPVASQPKPAPVAKPVAVAKQPAKAAPAEAQKVAVAPRPAPQPLPAVPVTKKPLKERVTLEFMVQSSPAVLYEMISSPSGFAEWYCTDVNVRGDQYTFIWPDEEESTTMIGRKLGEVIRFHRNGDDDEGSYFEFRVRIDAMTNEVALIVTDHAWPAEVEETRNLWNSQIASLFRVLGA